MLYYSQMPKHKTPFPWFGGKFYTVKYLLKFIPPHHTYVEVFGGAANLLFAKSPSPVEVYNDIDSGLVNFFRVLRDEGKFEKLMRKLVFTPYSREEFLYCRDTWQDCEDEVEKAYRWYVAVSMSFGGIIKGSSWGYNVSKATPKGAPTCSRWKYHIETLPWFHERIMRVQIEHLDFRDLIPRYDREETLFYCDPPYILERRRGGTGYFHEMTNEDHRDLVNILLNIKGMALLSGYWHPIYQPLEEAGWKRFDYKRVLANTLVIGRGKRPYATDSIWISPNTLKRLEADKLDFLKKGGVAL